MITWFLLHELFKFMCSIKSFWLWQLCPQIYNEGPVGLLNITLKFLPAHFDCHHITSAVRLRSGKRSNYLLTYASATLILSLFCLFCWLSSKLTLNCFFKHRMQSWGLKFNLFFFVAAQIVLGVQQLFLLATIYQGAFLL